MGEAPGEETPDRNKLSHEPSTAASHGAAHLLAEAAELPQNTMLRVWDLRFRFRLGWGCVLAIVLQIEDLFLSGVDVFRLNFSHGLFSEKYQQYKYIREIEHKYQTPIGVLADLPGPKLRLSVFDPDEVTLVKGQKFILDASAVPGGPQRGPLQQKWVLGALRVGHRVLIDDGKVRLRVIELSPRLQQHQQRQHMQQQQQVQQQGEEEEDGAGDSSSGPSQDNAWVLCVVETGGPISSKKGVSLPDTYVPVSALTKRDEQIAAMVTEWGVDWIALSFVQSAADIHKLRRVITAQANALEGGPQGAPEADIPRAFAGPIPEAPGRAPAPASLGTVGCVGPPCVPPLIMAKIERAGALQQLGAIAAAADGLMVARGDLGLELNSEFVPKAQRDITAAGRQTGKPVVVATQMLETMMTNPLPSRAEAADVAAAVMSGAAAVMLSGETAASSRGPHIARMQHSIIQQTEADPKYWALNTLKSPQAATVFAAAAAEAGTHPWGAPSKQGEERQESPTGPLEALSEGSQGKPEPEVTTEALAVGAEMMARVSAAKAILLNTKDSRGGPYLSSLRPKAPIVAATEDLKAARRLQLYWGVHPIFLGPRPQGPEEISKVKEGLRQSDGDMDEGWVDAAKRGARAEGFIKGQGDLVVVVGPPNQRGAEDEVSSEAGAEEAVRICTAA